MVVIDLHVSCVYVWCGVVRRSNVEVGLSDSASSSDRQNEEDKCLVSVVGPCRSYVAAAAAAASLHALYTTYTLHSQKMLA